MNLPQSLLKQIEKNQEAAGKQMAEDFLNRMGLGHASGLQRPLMRQHIRDILREGEGGNGGN
ncbi:hypothetical protein EII18_12670 [Comamonadaceae bacterium OH3737_COT-264]|nr:hypothetical protein EII18_12670 [Comamonadaceae bacterium OH3737_COT-264]